MRRLASQMSHKLCSCYISAQTAAAIASAPRYFADTAVYSDGPFPKRDAAAQSTPDQTTKASVVVLNTQNVTEMRDKMAREKLIENLPEQRVLQVINGLRMTVPYTLKIIVPTSDANAKAVAESVIDEVMTAIDATLNNYNPESEVAKINASEELTTHTVSHHFLQLLRCIVQVHHSSGGSFDPSVAPLMHYIIENKLNLAQKPPTPEQRAQIDQIAAYSNLYDGWSIDLENSTLTKKHPKAMLDLGGVSKGYTVDLIAEKLIEKGYTNFFFEWGGDCRASGTSPSGASWAVGAIRPPNIEDLNKKDNTAEPLMLRVIMLDNESVATSGDYENLVEIDGAPLSKTLDTRTRSLLEPSLDHVAQISVKNKSCMYADALATAAMIKRDITKIRFMMEEWRYDRNPVTDYVAFIRHGERVAHMHEIAKESPEMREERAKAALPARVIIIGGGLAGLSAAVEAASMGASVVVLEKSSRVGGNSAKATSGINGWGTLPQAARNIRDDGRYFERDTYLSGNGGNCDHGLVKMLSVKSGDAVHWLSKTFDIPLTVVSQLGGHSRPRTHRAPDKPDGTPVPIGFTIMRQMEHYIRTKLSKSITIITDAPAIELMSVQHQADAGRIIHKVIGVKYKTADEGEMELTADAVVLATGGFANDHTENSLLKEFAPQLVSRPTTNGPFATGDGVKMARQLGARLIDMDKVQLHPTGFIDPKDPANTTKYLGPEALRGSGGILLNSKGERFINELDLRSVVSKAITDQNDVYPESNGCHFAYCVLNSAAADLFGRSALGFYWKKAGLFVECQTVQDLADHIKCSVETVQATLEQYEKLSRAKEMCPKTKKVVYPCVLGPEGPFYVACVSPSIHYTMGGVLISPSGEVMSQEHRAEVTVGHGYPIEGLFGAGEVTGGVHGRNRLGGNSLLECVVFGRIAGDRAATILQRHPSGLSTTKWSSVILSDIKEGGVFGHGSRILVFSLPGSMQRSGLKLGQFVAIRGEWDGQHLIGYYSPITLPSRLGSLGILARVDRGSHKDWIAAMSPGIAVELKACGGLIIDSNEKTGVLSYSGKQIRKLALLAGGSGIAPMLQLIKAAMRDPYNKQIESLRLVYAAETEEELTYRQVLEAATATGILQTYFVLNHPPAGWLGGVGLIDEDVLSRNIQPPADDLLVVLCGPPVMQKALFNILRERGYNMNMVRSVDGDL